MYRPPIRMDQALLGTFTSDAEVEAFLRLFR